MATTHSRTADDTAAIDHLHESFAAQRAAFLADQSPGLDVRLERINAVAEMVLAHRLDIRAALSSDFGSHPPLFADMVETLGMAGRAAFVAENLPGWLEPEKRAADPAMYGTGWAEMRHEPKGVIGNIVPWNFPFDLSLGPLIDMLAAGNRVIIKPSEFAPACADLLAEMIAATFPADLVTSPSVGSTWRASSPPCAGTTCSTPAARGSVARSPRRRRRTWCRPRSSSAARPPRSCSTTRSSPARSSTSSGSR